MSYIKCWLFKHKVDLSYGHNDYRCQRCGEECEPTTAMLFKSRLNRQKHFHSLEKLKKKNEQIDIFKQQEKELAKITRDIKKENAAALYKITRQYGPEHAKKTVEWAVKERQQVADQVEEAVQWAANRLAEQKELARRTTQIHSKIPDPMRQSIDKLIDSNFESQRLLREADQSTTTIFTDSYTKKYRN